MMVIVGGFILRLFINAVDDMTSVDMRRDETMLERNKKTKKGNDRMDDALLSLYDLIDSFFVVVVAVV